MGMTLPCLPGVGLVDVDDIAQPQRWNTGVEQFLLWLGQKKKHDEGWKQICH